MSIGSTAESVAEEGIAIPRNVMGLLRASYDTREKHLDWLLAIATVGVVTLVFWPQIKEACTGAKRDMVANQNVGSALKGDVIDLYTYNLPPTRQLRNRVGPSGTRVPFNPGYGPWFPNQMDGATLERSGKPSRKDA